MKLLGFTIKRTPKAKPRVETAEYRRNRTALLPQGCWARRMNPEGHTCEGGLQAHHFVPYASRERVDFAVVLRLLELIDFYGWGLTLRGRPMKTIDDIRNLLALCEGAHVSADGIHNATLADWAAWICRKPVPV